MAPASAINVSGRCREAGADHGLRSPMPSGEGLTYKHPFEQRTPQRT